MAGFGINRVLLVGNLTTDPELRHTQAGNPVCGLRLAVNGTEKNADGNWVDRADYFDVRVWGNQAESCAQYLTKGSPVAIDGRLRREEWDSKDGSGKREKVLIVASSVQFLSRGNGGGNRQSAAFIPEETFEVPTDATGGGVDDDIPF